LPAGGFETLVQPAVIIQFVRHHFPAIGGNDHMKLNRQTPQLVQQRYSIHHAGRTANADNVTFHIDLLEDRTRLKKKPLWRQECFSLVQTANTV
jgi:hypothetical protein